jgi:hypothetical protein
LIHSSSRNPIRHSKIFTTMKMKKILTKMS